MRFIFPRNFKIEVTDDVHGNLTYRLIYKGLVLADLTLYDEQPE